MGRKPEFGGRSLGAGAGEAIVAEAAPVFLEYRSRSSKKSRSRRRRRSRSRNRSRSRSRRSRLVAGAE